MGRSGEKEKRLKALRGGELGEAKVLPPFLSTTWTERD